MQKLEHNQTLCQIIQLFYFFGIWQRDDESKCRKMAKKILYLLFSATFPIFSAVNALFCCNKQEAIFSVQVVISTSVLFLKSAYLVFEKDKILQYLNDMITCPSVNDQQDHQSINEKIMKFTKFIRVYLKALFTTVLILIGIKLPIISADKTLPLFISFSWNDSEVAYWFAFVLVSLSLISSLIANFLSVLIWFIMLNYSVEYQMLGGKLHTLGWQVDEARGEGSKKTSYSQNLINLIGTHQKLIK